MIFDFETYQIAPIAEKDAWRLCDFVTANLDRLKRYFPKTLEENQTPTLSRLFVDQKVSEFDRKQEFLFTLKEKETRAIIGLIYVKKLDWNMRQAEIAYCIGYQYEGKGIITEAVKTLSHWATHVMNFKTLQIITHKTNTGSVKVAEKAGYVWKDVLKKEHTPPGESPLDMELYEYNV